LPTTKDRHGNPRSTGMPASLLRQIKAVPWAGVLDATVMIRNCAMRFAAALFALAVVSAPLAARAADVEAGKAIFNKTCNNCHSTEIGVNKIGPSLYHVIGRPSAVVQDYSYSEAMKNLHHDWSPEALDAYLSNPRSEIHGVKMYFKGLPDPQDRADVIAYLQSLQ
jgi:cytochrome c